MIENDLILCPHCGEITNIRADYTESNDGTCYYIFQNNEPITVLNGGTYDGYHDDGNNFFDIHRHYCDCCDHDLTEDEIVTGRNNYLAAATKENT